MPRGDRRGPRYMGPMTGRGFGYCAGFPGMPYVDAPYGYGRGYGYGMRVRGRGYPFMPYHGFPVQPAAAPYMYDDGWDEEEVLAEEARFLQEEVDRIGRRIEEINRDLKSIRKENDPKED